MNKFAGPGEIWVCAACGKHSEDKYGTKDASHGWDVACTLNAVLCYKDKLVGYPGMITAVLEGGIIESD